MAETWEFTAVTPGETVYADGTRVPELAADVMLDGAKVGRINVHLHRHRGRDGLTDTSFGATFVAFSTRGGN